MVASGGVVEGISSGKPGGDLTNLIDGLRKGTVTKDRLKTLPGPLAGDALSYFANRNETDMVERLIGLSVSPDQSNSFGTNALIVSIGGDGLDAASALVAAGADTKAATSRGTPVGYADKVGSVEMRAMLRTGKVPSPGDRLRSSARKGELESVRRLIASGTDPASADDKGVTPILEATQAGYVETVRLLLKLGAGAEGSPKADLTPLAVAVVSGNAEMARALLGAKANPNMKIRGVPILSLAVIAGSQDITDLLLAAKADTSIKGDDGTKPADLAAAAGQPDLAGRLGGSSAFSPSIDLFSAIKAKSEGNIRAAIDAGADPNQKNAEGYPALVYSAALGNRFSVGFLMLRGADPVAVGPRGLSALHAAYARQDGESDVIAEAVIGSLASLSLQQLLSLKDDNGRSAAVVMAAHNTSSQSPYLRTLLISRPAIASLANAPDGDGITPLEAAVLVDNDAVVRGFIDGGATPAKTKEDMSLQDLARAKGAWRALYALPSDRVMPDGLEKGAPSSAKRELQALLSQWGYYKGKQDGTFGKTSRAAAVAFFRDRGKEMRKIATDLGEISRLEHPNGKPGDTKLSMGFRGKGDLCTWKLTEWYPNGKASVSFVGCVKGDKKWNSNGIGYTAYGDGSDSIQLFGDGGWEGAVDLR
ncbi:hypothetical protein X739_33485 [Mesorhizobium sp. LNHC220B00]|nr:hypothetical protein X739_33485 [Mesorhizobium sp. LNHC220B00]